MKIKRAVTGVAAFACMSGAAHAQSADTFFVTGGWFHFAPLSSSGPLKETSVGGSPVGIDIPNTGASLSNGRHRGLHRRLLCHRPYCRPNSFSASRPRST